MEPERTLPQHPKVRDDIAMVEIDGEAVLLDSHDQQLHHLNATATIVFQLCDGTGTVQELAVDIGEAFGVPLEQVRAEVGQVVEAFDRRGFLVGRHEEGAHG